MLDFNQSWLEMPLEKNGFQYQDSQIVMVRHTVQAIRRSQSSLDFGIRQVASLEIRPVLDNKSVLFRLLRLVRQPQRSGVSVVRIFLSRRDLNVQVGRSRAARKQQIVSRGDRKELTAIFRVRL